MSPTLRSAASRLTLRARPVTICRTFAQSTARRSGGSSYDPPSGWLFGVKPGEKYEKEGWEGAIYYGLCGAMAFGVVAYAFKPDTRYVRLRAEKERSGFFPRDAAPVGGSG